MRVTVNADLCEGHGKCQAAAAEVFELRDDDQSHVLMERPPEAIRAKVERAARLCPRQAITLSDD